MSSFFLFRWRWTRENGRRECPLYGSHEAVRKKKRGAPTVIERACALPDAGAARKPKERERKLAARKIEN
jgi:hypothetical protein